jgi:DNA-binding transcriptional regulator YiaG
LSIPWHGIDNTAMPDPLDALLARQAHLRRLPAPPIRRALREHHGLSQCQLAQLLGVDRASVSRYESGDRTPRPSIAERYLDILERLASRR